MPIRIAYALLILVINLLGLWTFLTGAQSRSADQPALQFPTSRHAETASISAQSNRLRYIESFENSSSKDTVSHVTWDTSAQELRLALQDSTVQQDATIVSGGDAIYVIWSTQAADEGDIYAQRIDDEGNRLWQEHVRVNSDSGRARQLLPVAAVDALGELWVVWVDNRSGDRYLYGQRLHPDGAKVWLTDMPIGEPATDAEITNVDQGGATIALMSDGTAAVAWHDNRAGDYDVYCQTIDSNGTMLWATDQRLNMDNSGQAQSDPALTTTAAGQIAVSWLDQRDGTGDIYFRRLLSDGTAVAAEQRINGNGAMASQKPAVTPSGADVVVAWIGTDGQVYLQRLNEANTPLWVTNFSVNPSTQPAEPNTAPALVRLDDNSVIVLWKQYQSERLIGQRLTTDGKFLWDSGRQLSNPALALTGNHIQAGLTAQQDQLYLTWSDRRLDENGDIFVQKSNAAGQLQWNTDEQISEATGAVRQLLPAMATHDGGTVVAWQDWRTGVPLLYLHSFAPDGSTQWHKAIRILLDDLSVQAQASVDVATSKELISVVWADNRSGVSQIYVQQFDLAGNRRFVEPQLVDRQSPPTTQQFHPKVGMDQQGSSYIVWEAVEAGEYYVYGSKLDVGLETRTLTRISKGRRPAVAVNASGRFQVAWLVPFGSDADVFTKGLTDFAEAGTVPNLLVNHLDGRADLFNPPTVAIDDAGDAAVVWVDRRTSGIYVQRYHGGTQAAWSESRLLNLLPGTFSATPDVVMSPDGAITVVWQDFTAGDEAIFAQRLSAGGDELWRTETFRDVVVSTGARNAQHPVLSVDAQGNSIIVWQDERRMNADIYLQQLNDAGELIFPQDVSVLQQDHFYHAVGQATSRRVNIAEGNVVVATVNADLDYHGGTITFELTNDGGEQWHPITLGESYRFPTVGNDLRWRATLQTIPTRQAETPVIRRMQIDYDTALPNDLYEPDDLCVNGQLLQVNGPAQQHTLAKTSGLPADDQDWIGFDGVAGKRYSLLLRSSAPGVSLFAALYPTCEGATAVGADTVGPLGQRILLTDTTNTRYNLSVETDDPVSENRGLGTAVPYAVSVRTVMSSGLAIIAAGRIGDGSTAAQQAIDQAADNAYRVLRARGYRADQIRYLATKAAQDVDGDGQPDVAGALSSSALRDAIQSWPDAVWTANEPPLVNRTLILYLVGDGRTGAFVLNGSEQVEVASLNLWLTNLEERTALEQSGIILEFPHAATFLSLAETAGANGASRSAERLLEDDLTGHTITGQTPLTATISGPNRIVLGATTAAGTTWPSPHGMLFSDMVWLALSEGGSFYEAFLTASAAIGAIDARCGDLDTRCQQPWYDDNGDGTVSTLDGMWGQMWGLEAVAPTQPLMIQTVTGTVETAEASDAANPTNQLTVEIDVTVANATARTKAVAYLLPTDFVTKWPAAGTLPQPTHPIVELKQIESDTHKLFSGTYVGALAPPLTVVVYAWDSDLADGEAPFENARIALPTTARLGDSAVEPFELYLPVIRN